jgi:hypothetical protein
MEVRPMNRLLLGTLFRFLAVGLAIASCLHCWGHPASGIVVSPQGDVYFVDTARGVFRISRGSLQQISSHNEHWIILDANGRFSGGTPVVVSSPRIYRVTPDGKKPAILLSSGVPITINEAGDLFYAPYTREGSLQVIKQRQDEPSVFARIERGADGSPLHWINGIAFGPDGAIYFTENAAVRKISPVGQISTIVSGLTRDPVRPVPGLGPALGPDLRGLAIDGNGNIWVAATGSCSVLKISPSGEVTTILRTESPWSPTGIAVAGEDLYILEYLHTATDKREEWLPRIVKRFADGHLQTIATLGEVH